MKYSLLTLLLTLSSALPGWCGYNVRHYSITMNVTSGTFNGQTYTGGFDVNLSGLTGTGTETLGPEAMDNFQLQIFGNQYGPVAQAASTVFSNGVLLNISTDLAFPSATEGNQNRTVGFNAGFSQGQVPPNLVNGPWFGYLTTATIVDGFGSYVLTLQPIIPTTYNLTAYVSNGTFAGQIYSGSFGVKTAGLTGVGAEHVAAGGITNFQITIFGNKVSNVPGVEADLVDGRVRKIYTVFGAPSAAEGNQNRTVGFNAGFSQAEVPAELVNGRWFGYLNPATFVDGFGSYELTPVLRHFRLVVRLRDGTFGGQTYYGSFDVNGAALRGIGTETLPATAMSNFQLDMFDNHLGPLASPGSCEFVDGRLNRIFMAVGVPSATDGNQIRNVGFTAGFDPGQIPADLVDKRWVGYLNPATFVDGWGTYDTQEEFATLISTPVVTNNNDNGDGSLREAIFLAASGDSINFSPNVTGTITLTSGELAIGKNLTIVGPGAKVLTVSGNNTSRVFHITGGTSQISGLRIANGHTSSGGGGIAMDGGSLTVNNCAITDCYAQGVDIVSQGGGAIAVVGAANLAIIGSTLSSNTTPYQAGGLYLFNAPTVSLVNCTVSDNRTLDGELGDGGGGIFVGNSSKLNITNSTIANNSSAVQGGGIYKGLSGTITVANSLIAGNSAAALGPDCKGTFVSAGYNLIGNSSSSTGFGATGDQLDVNPLIGSLADNGGPTFTHALLTGSPAIDKGNCFGVSTDQRGSARPYDFSSVANASDGSDIGAFEVQAPSGPTLTVTRSGSGVLIAWPSPSTGFVLQQNANLSTANWTDVSQTPADNGTSKSVLINPPTGNLYFRLMK